MQYIIITRKCYSIGRAKANSAQAILYCATSLSQLHLLVVRGPPVARLT